MHWLDWAIVAAYLIYITYDGLRLTKKSNEVEGYFLAHRSLPWWVVGLSVMATQLSAITLVGTTGQAYADGMRFVQFYFGLPFAMVILCMTVVPFFYRAKVYTAYEYLERRFDAKTRALTSFFFLIGPPSRGFHPNQARPDVGGRSIIKTAIKLGPKHGTPDIFKSVPTTPAD